MPSANFAAQNLGYWNAAAAARHPDKIAIFDLSRDPPREISYADLESRLDRVAATLARLGIKPGNRLAMSISNRVEFIETMFGAMRAGVVPVPLNTKLGADALRYVIEDSGAVGAVVEKAANANVLRIVEDLGLRPRMMLDADNKDWLDYEGELSSSDAAFAPPALPLDHMAFLPYTSGSTGKPKGVVLTHAGQRWWLDCLQRYWPMPTETRALVAVPLYHKNAMAGAIKPMLAVGGSVVLLPDFKAARFLRALSDYRCTHASGVPAVFTLLLQERDLIAGLDFSSGADAERTAGCRRGCFWRLCNRELRPHRRRTGHDRAAD
jgi:long-chain acyl-CoA synthetase